MKKNIVFLVVLILVSFTPLQLFARDYSADRLYLGKKWSLSGVGDKHADDSWLRLFNTNGTDYYGGFAAGKLWSKTGTVQRSDITLKQDIQTLGDSLEKIKLLRGVSFRWRDSENDQHLYLGLIAQEVEKVFPEVVTVGPEGKKGVIYSALIAPLINAIQEQDRIIEEQRTNLAALEERIAVLEQAAQTNNASVRSISSSLSPTLLFSGMFLLGGFGLVLAQRWHSEKRQ